jgi:iron complex outermembrane receptor protein
LADVDRIEVIRGPGSTLWGVNAMNDVVNIITKKAADTLGTLVEVGAGTNDESTVLLRHGAALDADTAFNAWVKYDRHGDFETAAGDSIEDQWSSLHGGFRLDGRFTDATTYTVQGDAYTHPTAHESVLLPVPGADRQFERVAQDDTINGGSLLFRALHGFGEDRGWLLRAYAARTERDTTRFGVRRDTADVEYRHWLPLNDANQLIWGVQYDTTHDVVDNGPVLVLDPASRSWSTLNAFVQNTTELVPDKLFLMVGSKFTEHSFVGFQTQPNVRLWWTPSERQTVWASVSRPVRVPSRFKENGLLVFAYADRGAITTGSPDGVIVPLGLAGNEDLRPEKLLAWEVGHRIQANAEWVFDTTLFYNRYQRLLGVPPTIIGTFTDNASGATWGGDFSVSGRLSDHWRVEGSYSRLRARIDGPVLKFDENSTPEVMAQVHSYWDIGHRVELNAALYHVGAVPFVNVDGYNRADIGLTWRPSAHAEYALWGQNLLEASHSEMSGAQVPRGVFLQATFNL